MNPSCSLSPRPLRRRVVLNLNIGLIWVGLCGIQLAAAEPQLVGQWPGFRRGPAYALELRENFAFVAAQSGGLVVADISDPRNPRRLSAYQTNQSFSDVALSGNYAYVAAGEDGLLCSLSASRRRETIDCPSAVLPACLSASNAASI